MVEMIKEVDENDNVIGLRSKDDFYTGELIHRSVHLILFNSKNAILLQRRALSKKWYPNLYTYSVSGTVADESYEDCIKKETREEIGISIPLRFVFRYSFFDECDKAFHAVFVANSDDKIKPDKREISEIKWISIESLKKDLDKSPEKYTPSFVFGMKKYFLEIYKG